MTPDIHALHIGCIVALLNDLSGFRDTPRAHLFGGVLPATQVVAAKFIKALPGARQYQHAGARRNAHACAE